ncbi:hypothetical protein GA0115254_12405 [Streptomyces sp. Ncost-T10-10d]|nr:hypothetical protein GA0115254_12405 [Streptomyces sp. Ncost-T10-10d]
MLRGLEALVGQAVVNCIDDGGIVRSGVGAHHVSDGMRSVGLPGIVTVLAALDRFAEFADAWGRKYPAIVRLWENAWEEFPLFHRPG